MSSVKCFDAVSTLIESVNDELDLSYCINNDRYELLKTCCANIDMLEKEFKGTLSDINIDKNTKEIIISITCKDIIIDDKDSMFYVLLKNAACFSIERMNNTAGIKLHFSFCGVWN